MSGQLPTTTTTDREHLLALWSSLPRLEAFEEPTAEEPSKVASAKQQIVYNVLQYFKRAPKVLKPPAASAPYSVKQLKGSYDTFLDLRRGKKDDIVKKFNDTRHETNCYP